MAVSSGSRFFAGMKRATTGEMQAFRGQEALPILQPGPSENRTAAANASRRCWRAMLMHYERGTASQVSTGVVKHEHGQAYASQRRDCGDHQGRRRRTVLAQKCRRDRTAVAGGAGMAAPFAAAVSDRRPPEERSTAASGQNLSDDAAWLCEGSRFEWVEREPTSCKLVLVDSRATRARYPFAFRLEVTYSVDDADLKVAFDITNTGDENLPASIGAHPAFNWPLLPGLAKEAYALNFSDEEPAPIRPARRRPDAGKAGTVARFAARRLRSRSGCSTMTRSSSTGWRAVRFAMRPIAGRRSKCPGKGFPNSASGRSRVAPRFSASSPGMVLPARRSSTANSPTSPD